MATPPEPTPDEREEAELYDLLHGEDRGDLPFYTAACAGARAVLELGCGSGRLVRALAEAGHAVVGVDVHPGLLAMAAEAAPVGESARLVHADMRTLALDERFDRVLIPNSALYAVGGDADQRAALDVARRHLTSGGALVMDMYAVDAEACAEAEADDSDWGWVGALSRGDGRVIDVYERDVTTGEPCVIEVQYRLETATDERGGVAVVEQRLRHRFLSREMLAQMLMDAGFRDLIWCGGFAGEPFDDDESTWLVVIAR